MAALGSLRQMNSKLNIQVININLSSERPRAIAANRCVACKRKNYNEIFILIINSILLSLTFLKLKLND